MNTTTRSTRPFEVCVIGAGPRGMSVIERLCANARRLPPRARLLVHVVDPYPPGAGQVWRTDQPGQLLMNTVASQVTLFTDPSVDIRGPLETGPSLYEWARHLVLFPDGVEEHVLAEARRLGPDTYPTRAFYGRYLRWVFERVVARAPRQVEVRVHATRATALDDVPGTGAQRVVLEDGTVLGSLDAVVLAQGHLPVEPTDAEREAAAYAAAHDLVHVPPANPADVDLGDVRPGEAVLLRGLGLNFFDHMALLTIGRGGRFERGEEGRLVYRPSGQEPRLYAGSRRGIPYQSRGENEKGVEGRHEPLLLTPGRIASLAARSAARGGLDFRADLWPLIAKEVETVYYATLLARRECECVADRFRAAYLAFSWGDPGEAKVLDAFGIGEAVRWDWERVAEPYRGIGFTGPDDWREWLTAYLRTDLTQARAGNVSGPLKAALDVLRDLRNEVRQVVDHGGLTGRSHRDDLDRWYTPLNAFLSIGPPAERVEQMIALIEAGVLTVIGPGMRVHARDGVFEAESAAVPGSAVRARVLVEARLPEIDLRRTADPLLRHLLRTGQCRAYVIGGRRGDTGYETGGLAVTRRPYRLLDADGRAHPRRFAYGVPTESVHWVTAAGVRPGVNSVILGDSDAIARSVLALTPARALPDRRRVARVAPGPRTALAASACAATRAGV
ncbi:FAD/NAD(P)-binding protein [Microbispora hainanensis]|uniref:FAD/NAD(P)-binding protein n=1 Tax=Microbispora hainanensis TaxID=568844 RepID=A0ABZ1SMQ8_9ACTN|nr:MULTISPECIES: FAD/NAD(P)-binding protein [Microbispora]NJP27022.1 FAD/NAD(P)-binding protein [Microbispora sp. CL1-1]TQS11664.1 FAD/NAD(P)-binding protein [Microbispora sp. SCL1-1]